MYCVSWCGNGRIIGPPSCGGAGSGGPCSGLPYDQLNIGKHLIGSEKDGPKASNGYTGTLIPSDVSFSTIERKEAM